uniref:Uncharacterized protein n=1 Tax=Anguilla anguilla TaxID=7936 RepID=A0A0E9SKS2_ANGAN
MKELHLAALNTFKAMLAEAVLGS